MTEQQTLIPASDYEAVRSVIAHLSETAADEADLALVARRLDMTERQLVGLFQRWCGLTPKSFAQAVALDHARRLLAENVSVLEATLATGLSSTSRLHDLFVTHEAMPPGAWRARGEGIEMRWGETESPFGRAVIVTTVYGIAGIGFADGATSVEAAFDDLRARWPKATYVRDDAAVAPLAERIFNPSRWAPDQPVRVVLIGTDFEVEVWETLLKIPVGRATTYGDVARRIGRPSASRAVGAAVGKNPVSFVVPCHRVVGTSGALTGYHWGVPRKRAMLGWESGIVSATR